MRGSSGAFDVFAVGLPRVEDGPEDVHAASGEGDDGLVVAFPLGALSLVKCAALGVGERDEGGLEEDALEAAVAAVGEAQVVVAASPTYRALYTGALKCFFDLMPQAHLAGKLCIGLQTGIAPQHALSPEYGLRPLFASLEGQPFAVLYATDAEFVDGQPGPELAAKLRDVAARAGPA